MGEFIPTDMLDATVHIAREAATPFNLMVPRPASSRTDVRPSLAFPGPGLRVYQNPSPPQRQNMRTNVSLGSRMEYPGYCAAFLHENFEETWETCLAETPQRGPSYSPECGWEDGASGAIAPPKKRIPYDPPTKGLFEIPVGFDGTSCPPTTGLPRILKTIKDTPLEPPVGGIGQPIQNHALTGAIPKKIPPISLDPSRSESSSVATLHGGPLVEPGKRQAEVLGSFHTRPKELTYQQRWVRLWPERNVNGIRDIPSIYFSKCPQLRMVTHAQFLRMRADTLFWGQERSLSDLKRNLKICRNILAQAYSIKHTPVYNRPIPPLGGRGISLGGTCGEFPVSGKRPTVAVDEVTPDFHTSSDEEFFDAAETFLP